MKSFKSVTFPKMEDKYDVKVMFNADSETLTLQFMNKNDTKTYRRTFSNDDIECLTKICTLSAANMYQLIVDQLSSGEFINKFCRLLLMSNRTQAISRYDIISKTTMVPDAVGIIEGDEGKRDDDEKENGDTKKQRCLLFVVHFSPSKYMQCNYCFVIEEKHLSDTERFMIKFNELKSENEKLRADLMVKNDELKEDLQAELVQANTTIHTLQQNLQRANDTIERLTLRVQQLERFHDESKMQEIDLNLENNWQRFHENWAAPKAAKIGPVVYLKGMVKGGAANTAIAHLPEGWRPSKHRMFAASQGNPASSRLDVYTDGRIYLCGTYNNGWLPLDAAVFVAN